MGVIQPFLDHILNIICNHDINLYAYIINLISILIQNHERQIETALDIIGEHDTDKNKFLTGIISKLFGC
jgi:hypothetical protein